MKETLDVNVLRKQLGGKDVLRDVGFHMATGEVAAVVAPSGAGKTTLLDIIAGLDTDFDGSLAVPASLQASRGVVFQEPRLMPWLTVRENVRLVLDSENLASADEWIERMGLSGVTESYPRQLSLGMQRRAAIARAIAVKPRLLLLDEAFVSLNRPVAEAMRSHVLESARHNNTTVLLATHDLAEAVAMSDRVLFLSASPARVLLDVAVPLPRPRNDAEVQAFCCDLQRCYPLLLHGDIETEEAVE